MFQIKLTPTAGQNLCDLHPEVRKQLKAALKILGSHPYQGKQLRDKLGSFRSLRIKRYRAIYLIDMTNKQVIIVAIGHRRDIYEINTNMMIEL